MSSSRRCSKSARWSNCSIDGPINDRTVEGDAVEGPTNVNGATDGGEEGTVGSSASSSLSLEGSYLEPNHTHLFSILQYPIL